MGNGVVDRNESLYFFSFFGKIFFGKKWLDRKKNGTINVLYIETLPLVKPSLLNPDLLFPFPLDRFQKEAVNALSQGKSVVVCAPTGSGKTLIGEYAIYRALSRGKRVFYTTPIKALSNQKVREFQEKFKDFPVDETLLDKGEKVGLVTGDFVKNPNAPIIVMTTEVFRNMLYGTPIGEVGTSLEQVETVILDECHYLSDRQRGTVWEESIIYCPPSIQLVALSATIGNPEQFTDWINQVRSNSTTEENACELINSDFRPVPLTYYISTPQGLFNLLNEQKTQLNPSLKTKTKKQKKPFDRKGQKMAERVKEVPKISTVLEQLQEREMLPAIYIIFSRRGCDQAVDDLKTISLVTPYESQLLILRLFNILLNNLLENYGIAGEEIANTIQQNLITISSQNSNFKDLLLDWIAKNSDAESHLAHYLLSDQQAFLLLIEFLTQTFPEVRLDRLDPLLRGISAHHAGLLPDWKKCVEKLFEMGLVKVLFSTETLAVGINMPARTIVISALTKPSDDGRRNLNTLEFLQLAGRAGRRGLDTVGHVVTVPTRFEGLDKTCQLGAHLATSGSEPLKSWFTPSYGMVLNLLQKHSLEEVKTLLERSFAEYLAQQQLAPEETAIAEIMKEITQIDIELSGVEERSFKQYEKLRLTLKEEQRVYDILQQQAELIQKEAIAGVLPTIPTGTIVYLKGKHLRIQTPIIAVLVDRIKGSGQADYLLCLGITNRWYIMTQGDIVDINDGFFPPDLIAEITIPDLETAKLGKWKNGDEKTALISEKITTYLQPIPLHPELEQQQKRVALIQEQFLNHPLHQKENLSQIMKKQKRREELRDNLHRRQENYLEHQENRSYYWREFLKLIKILQDFSALEEYTPTPLGKAISAIRSDNELWLGLVLMSGELEALEYYQLAGLVSAIITEEYRFEVFSNYPTSLTVSQLLSRKQTLQKLREQLNKQQKVLRLAPPVWLERDMVGLVETWAMGEETWADLCNNVSIDEGDIIRLLRRTIDVLWQIPQIPGIPPILEEKARLAISNMKRFPV